MLFSEVQQAILSKYDIQIMHFFQLEESKYRRKYKMAN